MRMLDLDGHIEQFGQTFVGQPLLQRAGIDDGPGRRIAHGVDAVLGGVLGGDGFPPHDGDMVEPLGNLLKTMRDQNHRTIRGFASDTA